MAIGTQTATKDVAAAGTAEALEAQASRILSPSILIIAKSTNTGNVYVGGSDVDSTNGIPLAAGENLTIVAQETGGNQEHLNPAEVYIDVDTNGEGVRYMTLKRVAT